MPTIPLATNNLVRSTARSTPLSGITNMPGVDVGAISSSFNQFGNNFSKMVNDLSIYNIKKKHAQEQSDVSDNVNKANLAIADYMKNLDQNNDYESYEPGMKKLYENYTKELDKSKLSEGVKKHVKLRYSSMFTQATIKTKYAANRQQIGQMRAKSMGRYDSYLRIGNSKAAVKEITEGVKLGFIDEMQGEKLTAQAARKGTYYTVLNEIKAGNFIDIANKLKETNKDKTSKNYPELKQEDRQSLIDFAGKEKKVSQANALEALNLASYEGKLTMEMVDNAVKTEAIPAAAGLRYKKAVNNPNAPKKFTADKMGKLISARDDLINERIDRHEYMKRYEKYSEGMPESHLKPFRDAMVDVVKPNAIEKKFSYKQGMGQIGFLYKEGSLFADPDGWFNIKDSEEDQARYRRMLESNLHDYMKKNPDANAEQVDKFINDATKKVKNDKITYDFAAAYSQRKDRFKSLKGELVRRNVAGGKVALFDAKTKKFVRYE